MIDNVFNASLEELRDIQPHRPEEPFNGFVIVPTGEVHDSGYLCMRFVLVRGLRVVGCTGGCSDVIHFNGIGGYGLNYTESMRTGKVDRVDWCIDILPNGCIRVFTSHKLRIGSMYSDGEIYDEGGSI